MQQSIDSSGKVFRIVRQSPHIIWSTNSSGKIIIAPPLTIVIQFAKMDNGFLYVLFLTLKTTYNMVMITIAFAHR